MEGVPHGFIHSNRGLRQGDPLSPYLFCIAMEYLSLKLEDSASHGKLKPVSKLQPIMSHLLYADAVLFFLEATLDNATELELTLEDLKNNASLQINELKSKVYFSSHILDKNIILLKLGMMEGQLPVKFLGVPLSFDFVNEYNMHLYYKQLQLRWIVGTVSCSLLLGEHK